MRTPTKSRAIVAVTAAAMALGAISIQPAVAASAHKAQLTKQTDEFSSQRRHRNWRGGGGGGAAFGAGAVFGAAAGLAVAGAYNGGYYYGPYAYEPYPYGYPAYGYAPAPRAYYYGGGHYTAPPRALEMPY